MSTIKKIKNIALCGGGFYGYAEVGALTELENYKEYLDIGEISGVSVGSIVASLYAIGYTPDELSKILFGLDFDLLIKDNKVPYYNMYENFGMYSANKLEEEIERLIREKTNIKFCTFSQIKMNLVIISTNLNYQCPKFFSKEHSPDMVISKAVRMSIGYPIVMSPVKFEGDLYGDGGEYLNYPITLYKNLDETLGITFSAHNENSDGTLKHRTEINTIYDYIRSIAVTMNRATYVSQIKKKHLSRSIVIHITENISSMQFNLSNEQKHFLYNCGVKAVKEQIHGLIGINKIVVE